MHEPAFNIHEDEYIQWDYGKGYVDALADAGSEPRRTIEVTQCPWCETPFDAGYQYCPRCGQAARGDPPVPGAARPRDRGPRGSGDARRGPATSRSDVSRSAARTRYPSRDVHPWLLFLHIAVGPRAPRDARHLDGGPVPDPARARPEEDRRSHHACPGETIPPMYVSLGAIVVTGVLLGLKFAAFSRWWLWAGDRDPPGDHAPR